VDDTYIKGAGPWASSLYCAIDSGGETIEFMLSPKRDLNEPGVPIGCMLNDRRVYACMQSAKGEFAGSPKGDPVGQRPFIHTILVSLASSRRIGGVRGVTCPVVSRADSRRFLGAGLWPMYDSPTIRAERGIVASMGVKSKPLYWSG